MAPVHVEYAGRRDFWATEDGHEKIKEKVTPRVAYTPDEWQIRLPGASLAGSDVVVVLKTGGGKTSLVTHSTIVDPDAITIMVSPLNLLEKNQVESFQKAGIRAVAINADTLAEARDEGRDLWHEATSGRYQVVLMSPEMLLCSPFRTMLEDKGFRSALARFVVDECHILLEWSNTLRPAYAQLADMRERVPEHVSFIAMTATLPPDGPTTDVVRSLGFRRERLILERRDCERTDMDLFIRELSHGVDASATTSFPDLDWLVPEGITAAHEVPKTLVYCDQIDLTHRVARYLRSLLPSSLRTSDTEVIRTVSSLSCPICKEEALETLTQSGENRTCGIHTSTDVLSMGVDVSDIERVICVGTPTSLSNMLQRIGRVARKRDMRGAAYVYIRKTDMAWARGEATRLAYPNGASEASRGRGRGRGRGSGRGSGRGRGRGRGQAKASRGKKGATNMTSAGSRAGREAKCALMDRILVSAARKTCVNREINIIMGNTNTAATYRCGACSSCTGDTPPARRAVAQGSSSDSSGPSATTVADATAVISALSDLAFEMWQEDDVPRAYSSAVFLSDLWKELIVDQLPALSTADAIEAALRAWKHWEAHGTTLAARILAERAGWLKTIARAREKRLSATQKTQAKRRARDDQDDEDALVARAEREAAEEAELEDRDESEVDEDVQATRGEVLQASPDADVDENDGGRSQGASASTATSTRQTRRTRQSAATTATDENVPPTASSATRKRKRNEDWVAVEPRLGQYEEASTGRMRRRVRFDENAV